MSSVPAAAAVYMHDAFSFPQKNNILVHYWILIILNTCNILHAHIKDVIHLQSFKTELLSFMSALRLSDL